MKKFDKWCLDRIDHIVFIRSELPIFLGLFYKQKLMPCYDCCGRGKIRNIKDNCPVEGYKMAPWYDCKTCHSSGVIHKNEHRQLYKK